MLRVIIVLIASLASGTVFCQAENQKPPPALATSQGGSTSNFAIGKFSGRVQERQGKRASDFDLDLSQNPGTITMYRADRACRTESIAVTSIKDDTIRMESKGNTAGCDSRIFELKAAGNELIGTMTIYDRVFDVKATK